jgi:uncharacterized protein YceH (UPF0502 family)
MSITLNLPEARVLGCLVEKERTTPEYYPLTMNSLLAACNQTTNRDPVVAYDESIVSNALDQVREKQLITLVHMAGARVPKYRHRVPDVFDLDTKQLSLLAILLLRGPQTAAELRARIERLCGPGDLPSIEQALQAMANAYQPLVRALSPRPGQKERRFVQLLTGEPTVMPAEAEPSARSSEPVSSEIEELRHEISSLRAEFQALRAEFQQFRDELGS